MSNLYKLSDGFLELHDDLAHLVVVGVHLGDVGLEGVDLLGVLLQFLLQAGQLPVLNKYLGLQAVLRIRIRLDPFHFDQPDPDPLQ